MRDKSKKLTVVNTGKKPAPGSAVNKEAVLVKGAGLPVNMSDYLLKTIWEKVFEVRTTEDGVEYLFCKVNWVSQYGITTYADGDKLDLPGIYDGLPIDNQTLYWVTDENGKKVMLKAKGGGSGEGGGIEYPLTWSGYSSGSWNGSETKNIYIPSKVSELTNDSLFIKLSDLDLYIEQGGYITDSALSDYLPKSGGTITGNLSIDGAYAFMPMDSSGYGFYFAGQNLNLHKNHIYERPILNLDSSYNVVFATTPLVKNVGNLATHSWVGANYLPLKGGTITGNLTVNNTVYCDVYRSKNGRWLFGGGETAISFGGYYAGVPTTFNGETLKFYACSEEQVVVDNNGVTFRERIWCVKSAVALYFQSLTACETSANTTGHFRMGRFDESDGGFKMQFGGTGTTGTLQVIDQQWTKSLFKLDKSGNLLVSGGITMYSDERKKKILNHVQLSLREVADAPLIEHYYNSDEKKTTHVGSIAQYWAGLNDWFCKMDADGFYTMEVQNAALASAISVARELLKYETKTDKQIRKLKKRISELEEEVELLKKM